MGNIKFEVEEAEAPACVLTYDVGKVEDPFQRVTVRPDDEPGSI